VPLWKHIGRKAQTTAILLAKPTPRNVNLGSDRFAMFNKNAGHPPFVADCMLVMERRLSRHEG
jgi:hypothetical protein